MRKHAMQMKLIPQRFSRSFTVLAAVLLVLFFYTASHLRNGSIIPASLIHKPVADSQPSPPSEPVGPPPKRPINRPALEAGQCSSDIKFLRRPKLELTDKILYSKRCVKPVFGSGDRDAVTTVSDPLVSHQTVVDLTTCSATDQIPCVELPLPVPNPYPQQKYSHMAFGIASKYDRIAASLPAFAHWLSGTGAKIVGVVVDAEEKGTNFDLSALEAEWRSFDIDATFVAPRLKVALSGNPEDTIPVEEHHFMLIRDIMEVSTAKTEWVGILDDDTFFPSLYTLDQALKRFDSSQPWWIGALSDDWVQVKAWGFMAYGGAGSFMSMPLVKQVEPHADQCLHESTVHTGDGMLRDCIYMHSRTRLTILDGLYQHDIHDDASGFYESGVRPLSLHHWKSWYNEPLPKMAAVTEICGDCFLQRYRFENDFLLVNGYSITQYPEGLDKLDLTRLEGTFPVPEHAFDFSYGLFRPKLEKSQKKSWKLKAIEVTKTAFRQIYVFESEEDTDDMDEVIELMWQS